MALQPGQLSSQYRSGGLTRRGRYLILATGCVFCCAAVLIAAPAQAAYLMNMWTGEGSMGMRQNTDLVWQLSNGNLLGNVPTNGTFLIPGQEYVSGVYTADLMSRGPTAAASMVDLNNSDIVHQTAGLQIDSQGSSIFSQSNSYFGCGSGGENICGQINATSFCDQATVSIDVMADNFRYESIGTIDAWAEELPDAMEVQMQGTGDGRATTEFSGISIAGAGFTNIPGYQNEFRDIHTVSGNFSFNQLAQWTSFRNTFDIPMEIPA